jgi:hypothetical protein
MAPPERPGVVVLVVRMRASDIPIYRYWRYTYSYIDTKVGEYLSVSSVMPDAQILSKSVERELPLLPLDSARK